MDRRNFSDLGNEIKDIVQNAVNTMNFRQLNKDIENTVKDALEEAKSALGTGYGNRQGQNGSRYNRQWRRREPNYEQSGRQNRSRGQQGNSQAPPYAAGYNPKESLQQYNKEKTSFPYVPVGRISGILLTIFGSIGAGLTGIAVFVLALIGQLSGRLDFFGTIALSLLPLFCASILMTAKGTKIRKRIRRFRRYLGIFRNRGYYTVKELSANVGLSKKYVLKDLRKMISLGMFPEGRIDEQETCLMLNRESYQQYLELQKNIRMKNFEEQDKNRRDEDQANNQEGSQNSAAGSSMETELRNVVENGRAYIRQIREANDAISGEDISRKLDRLEEVTGKIFRYVELHPGQLPEIQKFMEYYLPTTLKLVSAYREFDNQSVQGENITGAKNEIEATLDTINYAFERLLDSLFEDAAMDVSTDISVLETILAQEGLTKEDFKSN